MARGKLGYHAARAVLIAALLLPVYLIAGPAASVAGFGLIFIITT